MQGKSWQEALSRTRRTAFGRLASLLGATELTDTFWNDLETTLVQADVGIATSTWLLERMRQEARQHGFTNGAELVAHLEKLMLEVIETPQKATQAGRPHVILVVGVNGSGKTTTVARLARIHQRAGKSVLLAAADTFRAAAAEQLQEWGGRMGLEVISGRAGSDPAAVVHEASTAALNNEVDVLIADTSGRMHTSHNLMAELEKIQRVAGKVIDGAPHEILLVLDATTGQNGLSQARGFVDKIGATGIVLAKLDSSARGGVAVAIARVLGLPILYAGVGETLESLVPFDPQAFLSELLSPVTIQQAS